jgi:voltage-gated potassium channel Kch
MQQKANSQILLDRFLVCGLGSLGQQCVAALKRFEVSVIAIEKNPSQDWDIPDLPNLLDTFLIGDCRYTSVLEQAKIQQCRAVILVTDSEQVNAETALAVRKLNPETRLVVRSAKENLNELLGEHLGNFVAFEATQLPAPTIALAALGTGIRGLFNLEGQWLRVVKHQIQLGDRWCTQRLLHELNTKNRRILHHTPYGAPPSQSFHEWEPDARVQAGDTLAYIETTELSAIYSENLARNTRSAPRPLLVRVKHLNWAILKQQIAEFWRSADNNRLRQVGIVCAIILSVLLLSGMLLYKLNAPGISWADSFLTSALLLLGGFGDLFGGFNFKEFPVPLWLRFISLGMAIVGTIFVGIVYSFLTERLLAARFQLSKRRPPIPQKDHVVVVGLGRVGQRVATLLQQFKQPLVGISLNTEFDMTILPEMPLIVGNLKESLSKANLSTAKSVVVVTDEEMLNLEIGLMARDANPNSNLVIRTFGQGLSDNLAGLLPSAQVLGAYAVAAEAFAGAAFGEKILNLFRLNKKTILVTEYQIEVGDTLNGLLLSEVAYGYGVVPILYQKDQEASKLMPSEDIRLGVSDRIVVLATSNGLRRIERGISSIMPKGWRVQVEKALTDEAVFEGANALARISGCSLNTARDLMKNLPGTLQSPLYKHQAQRLVRELGKAQVVAHLVLIAPQQGAKQAKPPSSAK